MSSNNAVLNERDAAKFVGLSVHTMRARRFKGRQPSFLKLGKSIRYQERDLQAFLDAARIDSGNVALE